MTFTFRKLIHCLIIVASAFLSLARKDRMGHPEPTFSPSKSWPRSCQHASKIKWKACYHVLFNYCNACFCGTLICTFVTFWHICIVGCTTAHLSVRTLKHAFAATTRHESCGLPHWQRLAAGCRALPQLGGRRNHTLRRNGFPCSVARV